MIFPGCPVGFGGKCDGATLVRYVTKDGVKLEGARFATGKKDAPVALFFHGNGESAAQNVYFAKELLEEGIDSFLAEYRGYGGLDGEPSEDGLYLDGAAALEALGVPDDRLVLVGRSLGTGVATELAARGHGKVLVLVSPYTSMVDMGRAIAGPVAGAFVRDRFENEKKIAKLSIPVIVIHGTRDEVVPYPMGKKLAGVAKDARLITLEGVGHNDINGLGATIAQELRRLSSAKARSR